MKEKVYAMNTTGTSKDKTYKYCLRYIFGVNVEDLIQLLGPEAAVKLLHYWGGSCVYIPLVKTTRRRLTDVMLKEKCIELLKKGKTRKEIIDQLYKENVGYSKNTLKMKLVKWIGDSESKERTQFKDVTNEHLMALVSMNYDLFKKYRIV